MVEPPGGYDDEQNVGEPAPVIRIEPISVRHRRRDLMDDVEFVATVLIGGWVIAAFFVGSYVLIRAATSGLADLLYGASAG